jgi:phospholipid/cholesterol/gamma-HCH transport system permease protein
MICAKMATTVMEKFGQSAAQALAAFGDFWRFFGRTLLWMGSSWWRWRNIREVFPLMYEVGTRSVPVISVTGAFIGMVLAVEAYTQFKTIGQEQRLGSIVSVSVVKQIGPVLTAVMLAGRIGGSLTAELGTMNVTEQLDALRVMGADPVRVLVVPRFLACLIMTPILTMYSDALGVLGGWFICVHNLGIPNQPFWDYARKGIDLWTINEGLVESIFFGGAIAMIACYKGFTTRAGASGVGRACTESFVASFLAIIIFNFFFAKVAEDWYIAQFGIRSLFGG